MTFSVLLFIGMNIGRGHGVLTGEIKTRCLRNSTGINPILSPKYPTENVWRLGSHLNMIKTNLSATKSVQSLFCNLAMFNLIQPLESWYAA